MRVHKNIYHRAIVNLVSREFRNPTGNDKNDITENIKSHAKVTKLGEARIDEVVNPSKISRGNGAVVYVKVSGRARYAFLDLVLVDPEGLQRWFPNPDDVDSISDKGKLMFDGAYERRWEFVTTMDWKTGSYIAFVGLYEDTYDSPTINRRLIAYDQQLVEFIQYGW